MSDTSKTATQSADNFTQALIDALLSSGTAAKKSFDASTNQDEAPVDYRTAGFDYHNYHNYHDPGYLGASPMPPQPVQQPPFQTLTGLPFQQPPPRGL